MYLLIHNTITLNKFIYSVIINYDILNKQIHFSCYRIDSTVTEEQKADSSSGVINFKLII